MKTSSTSTIDGTESQTVIEQLRSEFPDTACGQGTIVFTSPSGERVDEERAQNPCGETKFCES